MTRICNSPGCGVALPEERKSPNCTACKREINARHIAKNPGWKKRNAENCRKRYWEDPEKHREAASDYRRKLRMEFIEEYGGRCWCCGEAEPEFLTIEHTDNGGKRHREQVGGTTTAVLLDLKRRNWPRKGYALLCFNCNRARWALGECPHETTRKQRNGRGTETAG